MKRRDSSQKPDLSNRTNNELFTFYLSLDIFHTLVRKPIFLVLCIFVKTSNVYKNVNSY